MVFAGWIFYGLGGLSIFVFRRREPDMPRPFRVPGVPVVPGLGILSCFVLMAGLPLDTWLRLIVWLAVGLVIYVAYGRRHSRLARP